MEPGANRLFQPSRIFHCHTASSPTPPLFPLGRCYRVKCNETCRQDLEHEEWPLYIWARKHPPRIINFIKALETMNIINVETRTLPSAGYLLRASGNFVRERLPPGLSSVRGYAGEVRGRRGRGMVGVPEIKMRKMGVMTKSDKRCKI